MAPLQGMGAKPCTWFPVLLLLFGLNASLGSTLASTGTELTSPSTPSTYTSSGTGGGLSSPVDYASGTSAGCKGEELLRVEASTEARDALTRWLAKDTVQLVFFYFDLKSSNVTYRPGACPDDEKSAVDAQTPLAWVLARVPGGGSVFESHSFARAYLTLPISFPRVYTLVGLVGEYVAYMHHKDFQMQVIVRNESDVVDGVEDCWNNLTQTEKASKMAEVLREFVNEVNRSTFSNGTSWHLCYSDPSGDDLPASASILLPATPAYVCQRRNGNGFHPRLKRDKSLQGLYVLLVCLPIGLVVLQAYGISGASTFARKWGSKGAPSIVMSGTSAHLRSDYFTAAQVPSHVTIGSLLSSDVGLGKKAFARLKGLLALASFALIYMFWPFFLTVSIVINRSPPVDSFGVSPPETFSKRFCAANAFSWGHAVYVTGPFALVLVMVFSLICLHTCGTHSFLYQFVQGAKVPMRWLSSLCFCLLTYLRLVSSRSRSRGSTSSSADRKIKHWVSTTWLLLLFVAFLLWLHYLIVLAALVTGCILAELISAVFFVDQALCG